MNLRLRRLIAALGLLAACGGSMSGDTVLYGVCAYDGAPADPTLCGSSQTCTVANTPDTNGLIGQHCTHACSTNGDCRAGRNGATAVCVMGTGGGQCYETCDGGFGCVYNQVCTQPTGASATVCVPTGYDAAVVDDASGDDDAIFDDVQDDASTTDDASAADGAG